MQDYLNGFNDGYKKAMEQIGKPQLEVTMDSKVLAEAIYKDVTELQVKDEERERRFK